MSSSRRSFLASGLAVSALAGADSKPSKTPVRYRMLGKTGLKVSEVGLGTEGLTDTAVLEKALDSGINFVDTARDYEGGNNEPLIGKVIRARRQKVILCTRSYADGKDKIMRDLDVSLKELGTDYIDVWYIGNKDDPAKVTDEMLAAQAAAQKAGKIRFKGLSTHRFAAMLPMTTQRKHFDVILVPYSFAMGTPRDLFHFPAIDEALTEWQKAGLGVVAMKVMAGGYRYNAEKKGALAGTMSRPGAHLAALKWVLKDKRVSTTIPSSNNFEKLEENLLAMGQDFGAADQQLLAAQMERIRPVLCRMCGSCDGRCPQGLPVADLVRYATYSDGYGLYPLGRRRFQSLPDKLQAVRCADCGECAVQCPQGVKVREQVMRAQELFA